MKTITKIFFLILILISSNCFAKEYYIKEAGITFEVPPGFNIVTPDTKDPNVKQEFINSLRQQNAVLYLYNLEQMAEIYVVYSVTGDSQSTKDYFYQPNTLSEKQKQEIKKSFGNKINGIVDNVSVRTAYAARYMEVQAHTKETRIKSYITVKNGASVGFNGVALLSSSPTNLDMALEGILNSVKYENNKIFSDTKLASKSNYYATNTSSSSTQKSNTSTIADKAIIKGVTKGLGAALLMGIFYLCKWLWAKLKNSPSTIRLLHLTEIKEIWFLFIPPIFALIAGFVTLPAYGLYILLKALVTAQSAFYAFVLWDGKSFSRQTISIFCIAFAFLFCPLFRIRMDKADWQILDIIFAIAFILINIFLIKPKPNK